jgi:predicted nucleotidyltransferase
MPAKISVEMEIVLPRVRCFRCLYKWTPRVSLLTRCPRCKSKLWNTPKIHSIRYGSGLGIEEIIAPHREDILRLARKYGAKELKVFGSVRRREARTDSDIDLLVVWEKNRPSMAWLRLPKELEKVLGHPVDLTEPESLDWSIRPQVEAEAVLV